MQRNAAPDLHLKTRLEGSYNYSEGEQYSSGKAISYTADNYTVKPQHQLLAVAGVPLAMRENSLFLQLETSKNGEVIVLNWRQNWLSATASIAMWTSPSRSYIITMNCKRAATLTPSLAMPRQIWRMKKLRLSAELRNLFNRKNYMETIYSGIKYIDRQLSSSPANWWFSARIPFKQELHLKTDTFALRMQTRL